LPRPREILWACRVERAASLQDRRCGVLWRGRRPVLPWPCQILLACRVERAATPQDRRRGRPRRQGIDRVAAATPDLADYPRGQSGKSTRSATWRAAAERRPCVAVVMPDLVGLPRGPGSKSARSAMWGAAAGRRPCVAVVMPDLVGLPRGPGSNSTRSAEGATRRAAPRHSRAPTASARPCQILRTYRVHCAATPQDWRCRAPCRGWAPIAFTRAA
jgi:hypothetical protein